MEIKQRILKLFRSINSFNKLEEVKGLDVGVWFTYNGHTTSITKLVGSFKVDNNSYFLVEEDMEEFDEICTEISKSNPVISAPEDVGRYLEELIWKMKSNGWTTRGIGADIDKLLETIRNFKGITALVTVPVWGLIIGDKPLTIGNVEFKPPPFSDRVGEEIKRYTHNGSVINTVAVTTANGDQSTIFENAKIEFNTALNVIRAFSQQFTFHSFFQEISIEGDFRPVNSFGYLEYENKQQPRLLRIQHGEGIGRGKPFELERYLLKMNMLGFTEFLNILNNPSKYDRRIIKAVDWLGEATKPDTLPAKYVKLAFSIDAMVGAEGSNIPDSGKKARIADRAAFLMAHHYKARDQIWHVMNDIIGKRDEIAHGGSKVIITEVDVEEAGKYARALLMELLFRAPKFKDVNQLAKWVRKQALLG